MIYILLIILISLVWYFFATAVQKEYLADRILCAIDAIKAKAETYKQSKDK